MPAGARIRTVPVPVRFALMNSPLARDIDWLNARIVDLGQMHGVETPLNEALTAMVRLMEGGERL